ncbi:MAG: hypothetical protein KDM64_09050, partial [Verrucomicrobiae bacterium]|nr:hypothetical protein [Verrucomicrobiae bacterium]
MIESTDDAEVNAVAALSDGLPGTRHPLEAGQSGIEKTEAGNYFVANYPPFSFWKPDLKPAVDEVLERPAPEGTNL